jgi:hypothetical protein
MVGGTVLAAGAGTIARSAAGVLVLVMFAAMSAGDEEAIRRLTAPSFWSTFFGRYTRSSARSVRLQRIQEQHRRAGSRRYARLPVDYQALAPEFIRLDLRQQLNNSAAGLSRLSWAGKYDLVFTRPPGARTDPGAAIANRTCSNCGATYRSELATTCAHCHTERPLAWDTWRLADITVVV